MSSYILSINHRLNAIACYPGPRRERLAAVVKENLVDILVVTIPNHAPATTYVKCVAALLSSKQSTRRMICFTNDCVSGSLENQRR